MVGSPIGKSPVEPCRSTCTVNMSAITLPYNYSNARTVCLWCQVPSVWWQVPSVLCCALCLCVSACICVPFLNPAYCKLCFVRCPVKRSSRRALRVDKSVYVPIQAVLRNLSVPDQCGVCDLCASMPSHLWSCRVDVIVLLNIERRPTVNITMCKSDSGR